MFRPSFRVKCITPENKVNLKTKLHPHLSVNKCLIIKLNNAVRKCFCQLSLARVTCVLTDFLQQGSISSLVTLSI